MSNTIVHWEKTTHGPGDRVIAGVTLSELRNEYANNKTKYKFHASRLADLILSYHTTCLVLLPLPVDPDETEDEKDDQYAVRYASLTGTTFEGPLMINLMDHRILDRLIERVTS